jgi:uncharacterized protein (TIRG00374 family)
MAAIFGKSKAKFWIGLIVSLVFLFLAFKDQKFDQIWTALVAANYWWVIPGLAVYFVGVYVRAIRWHFLLRPLQKIPSSRLFPVVVIGYMANDVLPVRMGEVVRAYVLEQREGTPKTGSIATIVVERIMDGLTMILFLAFGSLFIPINKDLQGVERIASLIFIGLIVVFLIVASSRSLMKKLEAFGLNLLPASLRPKLAGVADSFIDGLQVLRQWKDLLAVFALSIVAWACEGGMYWLIALSFPQLNLGWEAVLMTLAAANLFTLVPSSPGGVGPFEFGAKSVLVGIFSTAENVASSYVILVHAALLFPITLWGVYYWVRANLSLTEAEREREELIEEKKHGHDADHNPTLIHANQLQAEPVKEPTGASRRA